MIISKANEETEFTTLLGSDALTEDPPPAFEPEEGLVQRNFVDDDYSAPGGEPPPDFSPYEAEHFYSSSGNIVSHDPHLNEDGWLLIHPGYEYLPHCFFRR